MGISRLPNLMYKPLKYETLADLVFEFIQTDPRILPYN